ncbi:MAG: hypothetical protein JJT85_05440, partial [Chromatiales bacterium]|nr:hypothetical protein [Chromatiales bacterium]
MLLLDRQPGSTRHRGKHMRPELAQQIETQTQIFAPLIVEPDGVRLHRDELNEVPVEWTEPA